ncbi:mammalian cell entry protein [Rhodococcus sp. 05-340-1]|uniref:MCE family protein n=1 Tax=unclassified Rhodococcus (in: high G+C Gram-positive bacteria) TaxID=192944 RepID=UPI000B9A9337|nr:MULTISPECIES: MlaD family protein [unclassified Rhodococcus (in: high G+C Gram-positive bacteria)]OZD66941.1 mammalian cell entry protein [Rhodococcus sp. 05-340-2]OZD81018.1 mammalian cell entry protein [Rhodococcus sp. 05-340-1]
MSRTSTTIKLIVFVVVMAVVLACLVVVFGQIRFESTTSFRAIFTSASGLRSGDFVRVAGVEVGKVGDVTIVDNDRAAVGIDVGAGYVVTSSTTATVRYQNLVGDRYLELADGPGDAVPMYEGGTIPLELTSPALDLDQLIGSFEPLFQAVDPSKVNDLSAELVATLQGQGGSIASLLAHTATLTTSLADRDEVIGRVITNLDTTLTTLADQKDAVSTALDRAQNLASGLAADSAAWGTALSDINSSSATVADLLTVARPPLKSTLDELGRTAAQLDSEKDTIGSVVSRLPDTYAALSRLGAYGNFFNYYLCGIKLKIDTPDGRGLTTPLIGQETGRCAPR